MTTQLLVAPTPSEVLLAAAAREAGLLGSPTRRVLVIKTKSGSPGPARAARHLAEQLFPTDDVLALAELVDSSGDLGTEPDDEPELVVGTSGLVAGRALSHRWDAARLSLLASGAAAYGPTQEALQGRLAKRVDVVLHLDLVPGLEPLLLSERGVATHAVPIDAYRSVVTSLPAPAPVPNPTTLVLGRSAPWAGVRDPDQQSELLVSMVVRCAEAGHSRILLLLDPDTSPRTRRRLDRAAREARADLTVVTDDGPVEGWLALGGVTFVVGCATDALLVAHRVFGTRVAQLDTDRVLKGLDPFADPRRTAATLVGATVPDLRSWTAAPEGEAVAPVDLPSLMGTVAYAMEPELLAERRRAAIDQLASASGARRFIRRRRLTALRLPGGKRKVRKTLD